MTSSRREHAREDELAHGLIQVVDHAHDHLVPSTGALDDVDLLVLVVRRYVSRPEGLEHLQPLLLLLVVGAIRRSGPKAVDLGDDPALSPALDALKPLAQHLSLGPVEVVQRLEEAATVPKGRFR